MAGVFISYKKEDRDRVRPLVEGMRQDGVKVWWDQDIEPGAPWDETISQQIEAAACVVVIWSSLSVTAPWVKEEAGLGKSRGILVPVRIHDVDPPLGFGLIQTADLRLWKGDRGDQAWGDFVATIRKVLRGEKITQLSAPLRRNRIGMPLLLTLLGVGAVAAAALAISVFRPPPAETDVASREKLAGLVERVETAVAAPGSAEQQAWEAAVRAKSRAGYDAYLTSFPEGRFAPDARAGLGSCHMVEDVRYEPFEQRANVLGSTLAGSFGSREDAMLSARDQGRLRAEERCAALAEASGAEDIQTRSQPVIGAPMCQPMGPSAFTCSQQFWVTCTGRKPIRSNREVCG